LSESGSVTNHFAATLASNSPKARVHRGDIDPTFIITHRLPLGEAPRGYRMFLDKKEQCEKVVLHA
jgi:threonine dehydrogenase-like Zn-dependent dehydrogenase